MKRVDGRAADELRRMRLKRDYLAHPLASVMIECGGTHVLAAVTNENKVPPWMKAQRVAGGWLTCEYGMLPAATHDRTKREAANGKQTGRTLEIQRLIGRSLRSVVDLNCLGNNTIYLDCDVIDADGGTRCASISGASLALALAMRTSFAKHNFTGSPMRELVAAVSVGIVDGEPVLDLCYEEDSRAEVDMNVVMTESGKFVEIQGTAEKNPFSRSQLNQILDLAESGLRQIFDLQHQILDGAKEAYLPRRQKNLRPGENLGSLGDAFGELHLS